MALIGYGRVSKRDQNPSAQRDLLTAAGCDELFIDKASGKLVSRPELDAAMRPPRAGDVLVITRLDRLGRSVKHLAALAVELQGAQDRAARSAAGHRHHHRGGPAVLPYLGRDRRVL